MPTEPPLTVDAALRLPALRRGAPEVLAGADQLERQVRWAHSCEARHVPDLLEGDELLLMTGMGLGTAGADHRSFVRDLAARRVAGLVIELGHVFREMPPPMVAEARRLRLPLIALRREVRFVEVTRQVHTAILTRQLTVERRAGELHDRLTTLLLEGAGVPELLHELAIAVGNPVLLERSTGEMLFHAAHDAEPQELLAHWELLRARETLGADVAAAAAVSAAGGRISGRLVVVPHERPVDALTRAAAERTAPLVAMALLRAGEEPLLESRERGNFLHDVLTGRVGVDDMPVRAQRLGLPGDAERLLGVVVVRRTGRADADAGRDERHALIGLRQTRDVLRGWGIASLVGTRPSGDDVVLLCALPVRMARRTAVEHVVVALAAALPWPHTVAAGPAVGDWAAVPAALRAAAEAAETMRDAPARRWHDATEADVERLLWGLRDDDRLAAFARQRLQPVLEHDRTRDAALLPTLEALCDSHWHKASAARALSIQRQSLYARIVRVGRLLGADLEDPETRLGLDLAVRAWRVSRDR